MCNPLIEIRIVVGKFKWRVAYQRAGNAPVQTAGAFFV